MNTHSQKAQYAPLLIGPIALQGIEPTVITKLLAPLSRLAPPIRRLVVLIPDGDTYETELARQIWSIAQPYNLAVLLLGLSRDEAREPLVRRRLATLAALIRDEVVHVETRFEIGVDWLPLIRVIRRNSDLVVCHAEQRIARWGIQYQLLSQWLIAQMQQPVCVLAGFYPNLTPDHIHLTSRLIADAVPFAILIGFTALQILIHQRASHFAYTPLLSVSVVLECSLIGLWHFYSTSTKK